MNTTTSTNYAMSFPTLDEDGVVTEGHARCCRENGHATRAISGEVQPYCPRCGDVAHPEVFPAHEDAPATPTEVLARVDADSLTKDYSQHPTSPYKIVGYFDGQSTTFEFNIRAGQVVARLLAHAANPKSARLTATPDTF